MTRKQIKKKYTKISKDNKVSLVSGNQSFVINDFDVNISKKEGLWFQEMLVIAIEKILKEQVIK